MAISALQSIKPPWAHLLVVDDGQGSQSKLSVPPGFVMKTLAGSRCRTKPALLSEFARALMFPDYFGHNWDALEECLVDLEWLPAKGYVLVITEAEQLLAFSDDEEDYPTFVEIVTEAGETWSGRQPAGLPAAGVPFHTVLVVTKAKQSSRKNWRVPPLTSDKKAGKARQTGSSKTRSHLR